MFIRKIKSRKSTCFQIGKKQYGRFKLVKHVGCAKTSAEIEVLRVKAEAELTAFILKDQLSLFSETKPPKAKLLSWKITGYHQVFGSVYDSIGFPNTLLRDLIVARIVCPKSKIATIRYLRHRLGINLSKDKVFRFIDILNKDELTKIAFNFVSKKQGGVSVFEGHTFQLAIDVITKKYAFTSLTVVADTTMLSAKNLGYLESKGINYIVGARLKNLPDEITDTIFQHDFNNKPILEMTLGQQRLIVDYSEERAKKDEKNRERLIRKLEVKLKKKQPVIRKSKYLLWKNKVKIAGIDKSQIEKDKKI